MVLVSSESNPYRPSGLQLCVWLAHYAFSCIDIDIVDSVVVVIIVYSIRL